MVTEGLFPPNAVLPPNAGGPTASAGRETGETARGGVEVAILLSVVEASVTRSDAEEEGAGNGETSCNPVGIGWLAAEGPPPAAEPSGPRES